MNNIHSENTFETGLTQSLLEHGGYTPGIAAGYKSETGLFNDEVITFLQESQPQKPEREAIPPWRMDSLIEQ